MPNKALFWLVGSEPLPPELSCIPLTSRDRGSGINLSDMTTMSPKCGDTLRPNGGGRIMGHGESKRRYASPRVL